jgi:hypothetical protein
MFKNGVGNHWAHSLFYCCYNIYLHNAQHLFKLKETKSKQGRYCWIDTLPRIGQGWPGLEHRKNHGSDKTQLHHWVQQASYLSVQWWNRVNISPDWYITKIFTLLCFLQYTTDWTHRAQHIPHKTRGAV